MLIALVEKFPFFFAVVALYFQARVGWQIVTGASIDCFWGLMFLASFLQTRSARKMS
jgi:hypothetical protein